jgi:pyruvate dehydrogenase E2 component (dihydrolipoamide acetyltransferase)
MSALQDIVMPKLGLTMTEGTLAEWRVKRGDRVSGGDVLFIVETDKIANEVEAPAAGEIHEIIVEAGSTVPVGTPVARWTGPDSSTTADRPERPDVSSSASSVRILATPYARRLSTEFGIDLGRIAGSGPRGRIKAADVIAAKDRAVRADGSAAGTTPASSELGEFEPADRVQAATATRLTAAKQQIPHLYAATEANAFALLAMREQLRAGTGPRISITHLMIAAAGRALTDLPRANRVWRDGGFLRIASPHVGVAVQTPRGLLAPILRDAGHLSLDEVAAAATGLVERSRRGGLKPDDLAGGALTVSNVGMHNVTYLTPIVNPGQSAILGVGSLRQVFRPDANGAPVLKHEIGLVLAADHRVFDGVSAATLLNRIIHYLERPALLMRVPRSSEDVDGVRSQ